VTVLCVLVILVHCCLQLDVSTQIFKNAITLKTGLGVRQGHWKCHRLIERIRLPIDVL